MFTVHLCGGESHQVGQDTLAGSYRAVFNPTFFYRQKLCTGEGEGEGEGGGQAVSF